MRSNHSGSEGSEALSLPTLFSGVFRENGLFTGERAGWVIVAVIRGNRQESKRVPGIGVIALTRNLATIIDVGARDTVAGQIQRCSRADQSVEVAHHAVVPEEVSAVPAGIARAAYDLSQIVNPTGGTVDISRQRAELYRQ